MAEFDIDSFIDVPKLVKQFDALDARVEQSAIKMSDLIGKMGSLGMGTDYSKFASDLAAANSKILALEQKVLNQKQQKIKLSIEERTEMQALNAIQKLNATLTAENTSVLQKQDAAIKLQILDLQKYVAAKDTENQAYLEGIARLKQMSVEYDRTAKASGAAQMKTSSMYGATFSLTQVMRELPNFAISARIGFMSLSNNLPMLAESFSRVRHEIDDLTGKEKGFKGAFKEFGNSLLSLNTIMIVASTLLVLYGDDLVKMIGNMFKAEKATDAMRLALLELETTNRTMHKTMKDGGGVYRTAIDSITRMSTSLENSKGNTKESKYHLDEYNKSLGVTFGKATDVDMALKLINSNKDAYISAMKDMAFANAFFDSSAEDVVKRAEISLKSKNQIIKDAGENSKALYSDLTTVNKALEEARVKGSASFNLQGKGGILGGSTVTDATVEEIVSIKQNLQQRINKIADTERTKQYKAVDDHQKNMLILAQKYEKKVSDIYDKMGWGFPNLIKEKTKKQFSEINVLRVMYDREHAALVEKAASLEEDIAKSNLKGELNRYDQRRQAAQLYYDTITRLSYKDRAIAIANEDAKLEKEKNTLKQKYENNVRKFGAKSPEALRSADELVTGNAVLEANNADAIQKISDEFDKKILDSARKLQRDLQSVRQDEYADQVYYIEQAKQRKLDAVTLEAKLNEASAGRKSGIEILNSKLGGTSDNKNQSILNAQMETRKRLEIEKEGLLKELQLKEISGEKEKEIWRKLDENVYKQRLNDDEAFQNLELANMQVVEDAKASIVSNSVDTLKTLWDNYYKYQEDKIDKTLDKQKAANDESIKQYEDETDAGKHTAKELSDYKDRIAAYQKSQEEDAAEKKKQLEKEQFLQKQAAAVAEVWINYAINVAKAGINPVAQAWLLGSAIASTALIAAQAMPYFAEGGEMKKPGKAVVGDGGKNELILAPTGEWFVSPKVPTVVDMKAGTKIFPDINKLDLSSFLAIAQVDKRLLNTEALERELRGLRSDVRNQKRGVFNGMPLIKQLNNSDKYYYRRKGLMN